MRYPDSSKEGKTTHMKNIIFAVAMTSIVLTGCKKTKTVTVQEQSSAVAMDETTQAMMKVIINGEEVEMPDLPIAEIIEMAKKNGGGNVQFEAIADMVFEDEEDNWLDREHEEEFEFMHKVGIYHAVGEHLSEESAMAILGVHMLRDNVEPELRIELLDGIIEATFDREPGRNAALLVAIETMMEMGEEEEAAWYMTELVISNSDHGHGPWEDDGHEHDDDDWDEHDYPHPHDHHDH